jgi:hypothetical protein
MFLLKYAFYIANSANFKKVMKSLQVICTRDSTKVLKESKRNISAEKRVLYGKLGHYQKICEIIGGHLYQGLGQSPQSFLMFEMV